MAKITNGVDEPGTNRLPSGTVTFLFTDIEGSTRLVQAHPDVYPSLLERHRELVRGACRAGVEFGSEGDALFFAFATAGDAVSAAAAAQRALVGERWLPDAEIRVRMGVSTGVGQLLGENYVGIEVHRTARICAAAHGGQVLASEQTAALCRPPPEGVSFRTIGHHLLKDFDEPTELTQVVGDGCPDTFPPPRTAQARIVRLPRRTTDLVGRDDDLAALQDLVVGERLVTLTGPGGSGKTRLAVAAAWNAAPLFRGHVAFVPLAHLAHASDIADAVSRALGWEGMIESWDDVLAAFRDQNALLIVDNLEHLLPDAAAFLDDLLERCPRVHVVTTTRIPAHVAGEQLYPVKPLAAADAVALLVERARRDRPDYAPTTDETEALAAIAAKLDGLPLALELAGARLRALPSCALLERLERQPLVLEASDRSLPNRLRTVRGAIRWSYDLLAPEDQTLLRTLSVFPTPATLEAIAGVADLAELEALDGLTRLIDASVAQLEDADGPRYGMLEPIRQFALDELEADGTARELGERMFGWYARRAAPLSPHIGDVLPALYHDRDNVRRALRFAAEAGEWHRGVDLCFKLTTILYQSGATAMTTAWRTSAEANPDQLSSEDWAKLALIQASSEPDLDDQIAALHEAIGHARAAEQSQLLNVALLRLAQREFGSGMPAEHVDATLARIIDPDPALRIFLAGAVALTAGLRNDPDTERLWEEAEELARRSPLPYTGSEVLNNIAWVAVVNGHGERARTLSEEALRLDAEHSAAHGWYLPKSLFDTRHTAALAAVLTGDVDSAAEHFTAVLVTANELGASERVFTVARLVHGVSALLAAAGRSDACVRLLGFAEPRIDHRYDEVDAHQSYVHLLADARTAAGERTGELEAAGRRMSDQQALELALNEVQVLRAARPSPAAESRAR